jgi:FlaA1/EpsC-like NDP-sugar epimerase
MKKVLFNSRSLLSFTHDILIALLAWYFAFALRFNINLPFNQLNLFKQTLLLIMPLQGVLFLFFGLYRLTWRFVSISDLKRILITVLTVFLIQTIVLVSINNYLQFPRSILILNPILLFLMMGGSRFIYRIFKEYRLYSNSSGKGKPVIIFGAGSKTNSVVKELAQSSNWNVVAILDDDKTLHGREIYGIKILGHFADLDKFARLYDVHHIIILMHELGIQERRKLLNYANKLDLEVLTVPLIDDLISGYLSISEIRRIDVEDLLRRDSVDLDSAGLQKFIEQKSLLITGAGGSIGSEICRQILRFCPNKIICLDISEYALYQLELVLRVNSVSTEIVYLVGDIRNSAFLDKILKRYQPKIVFHSAAYKHVPLMENENVVEAINNNVLGTFTLAKACKKAKVEKFVMISTDKAVNPTNVMGATKRLAEMVCQGLQGKEGMDFVLVRFGNVLGSSGSVIPKFREQIKVGGPITVTHKEVKRYFMSIPEAAQLVMQAGLMGKRGEIFIMDMGEPIRIVDLAKDMIKFSGFNEDEISIEFTGLRPGEKLYEELFNKNEKIIKTSHSKLQICLTKLADESWVNELLSWINSIIDKDERLIKEELKTWVKEYQGDIHTN